MPGCMFQKTMICSYKYHRTTCSIPTELFITHTESFFTSIDMFIKGLPAFWEAKDNHFC